MKAIVLSVKKGQAALLLENGMTTYRRMKVSPGERVEIQDAAAVRHRVSLISGVAAAMLAVVVSLTLYYTNVAMAYSYVSVDVNPSVEFVLNRMNSVLDITAQNSDGDSIVEEMNRKKVKGMKIEDAMKVLMGLFSESAYLEEDGSGYLLVAVSTKNRKLASELSEQIEHTVSENEKLEYLMLPSSVEERDKAAELGLSTGRYLELIQTEGKSEPEKKLVEQYRSTPVQEFMDSKNTIENNTEKNQSSSGPSGKKADAKETPVPTDTPVPEKENESREASVFPNIKILDDDAETDRSNQQTGSTPRPETPNPATAKPESSTPKPENPNPATAKPESSTPKPENPNPATAKPESSTPKPENPNPATAKPENGTPKPENPNPATAKPENSTPKPENPNPATAKPERSTPKPENPNPMTAKPENNTSPAPGGQNNEGTKPGENTNTSPAPGGQNNEGTKPGENTNTSPAPGGQNNEGTKPGENTNSSPAPGGQNNERGR